MHFPFLFRTTFILKQNVVYSSYEGGRFPIVYRCTEMSGFRNYCDSSMTDFQTFLTNSKLEENALFKVARILVKAFRVSVYN